MIVVLDLIRRLAHDFVGARAFALGGGDEEVVGVHGDGARVPVGGNELRYKSCVAEWWATRKARDVEDGYCIKRRVSHKECVAIRGLRQRAGIPTFDDLGKGHTALERLTAKGRCQPSEHLPFFDSDHCDFVNVRECDVEYL